MLVDRTKKYFMATSEICLKSNGSPKEARQMMRQTNVLHYQKPYGDSNN